MDYLFVYSSTKQIIRREEFVLRQSTAVAAAVYSLPIHTMEAGNGSKHLQPEAASAVNTGDVAQTHAVNSAAVG